jgi:hypothetical protein
MTIDELITELQIRDIRVQKSGSELVIRTNQATIDSWLIS